MSSVLYFKNIYYTDAEGEITIKGESFQALMELCFSYADTFSLHRSGWPGAHDGALEQALRPWLLGEYNSYGILNWFGQEIREKCYLYQANRETKEILLRHIHHLFEAEKSLAAEDYEEYLCQKYEAYDRVAGEISSRFSQYMDAGGREQSEEQREAVLDQLYQEAREQYPEAFLEREHYSNMEDPCFFQGTEMFFETITHEQECWVKVLSPEFEADLQALGEWLDFSEDGLLPLFSLTMAEGLKWYRKDEKLSRESGEDQRHTMLGLRN